MALTTALLLAGNVARGRQRHAVSDAIRCEDRMTLSLCNLFTGSQFIVPCCVLAMHGCRVLSVCAAAVCTSSLVFHRHCLRTSWRCNPCLRALDMCTTLLACTMVAYYGYQDFHVMFYASGVPLFYVLEVSDPLFCHCSVPHTLTLAV